MKKQMYWLLVPLMFLVTASLTWPSQPKSEPAPLPPPAPAKVEPVQTARSYVEKSVALSQPRLSPVRTKLIVDMITGIANSLFDNPVHREYWIALLGVESRYEGTAKSSAGAVGIGQLLPAYKNDFGKDCGLTDVAVVDLQDDYTNAYLSACYFRTLIQANDGNAPLALVAYNAGMSSKSLSSAKKGGAPAVEPSGYVTKVVVKKASTEGK